MRYEAVFSGGKLNPTTQQLTLALTMSGQNQAGSALLVGHFECGCVAAVLGQLESTWRLLQAVLG